MNSRPSIVLDESTHTYTVGTTEILGVTRVLERFTAAEYRGVSREVMEAASRLGQAVHKLIELDVRGELDETSVDDRLQVYLAQWRQFVRCSGFVPLMSEQIVYSERYGYAGKLDLFGIMNGRDCLIDAKRTAAVPRTAGPQTAAYELALHEQQGNFNPLPCNRYALHLTPDRWQLVPFKDKTDARVFLAALTCHKFEAQL